MMCLLKLTVALTLVIAVQSYIRVCYFTNWAQYRTGVGKYDLSRDYQTGLCTHVIFAFGKLVVDYRGVHLGMEWKDEQDNGKMQDLKKKDPNLKTLLSIGGYRQASNGFKEMIKTWRTRQYFIQNSIEYLTEHGFNGLDLDWEYPGVARRGSLPEHRKLFTLLCKELSKAYKSRGLLVTAAVRASVKATTESYEVRKISQALDFVSLMTYDLYGSWARTTGHHTSTDPKAHPDNIELTVKTWIQKGAKPEKLVLGLATYGRTFTLANKCNANIGSASKGAGKAGAYTRSSGFLAYYEICNLKWDSHACTKSSSANAPYGSVNGNFIGYDDQESIVYKINNIMKKHRMKGYMFWALDLDDFSGRVCDQGRYPLMNAAKKALMRGSNHFVEPNCRNVHACGAPSSITKSPILTTTKPTPTTTATTTTTTTTITPTTTTTTTTTKGTGMRWKCKAAGAWESIKSIDRWCNMKSICRIRCAEDCQHVCNICSCL